MYKPNISKLVGCCKTALIKHSPEILMGVGIGGMITTVGLAVKATPKALTIMDEEIQYRIVTNKQDDNENIEGLIKVADNPNESEKYQFGHYRLPYKDAIKVTWRCYISTAVTGVLSIACLIGASSVHLRRNTALAAAYTLSESALKEYKSKVIETIGEKKEKSIRESIAKDRLEQDPVSNKEIVITKKGDTLCYDIHSGRYFKSDIEKIKKTINELNRMMITDGYVSLNELYYELGLAETKLGNDLGWNIKNGLIDVNFSSHLASDGTPCLAMDYSIEPRYDFDAYM